MPEEKTVMTGRRILPACLLLVLCSFSISLSQARSGQADTMPIFEEWMKPLRDLGVTTIAFRPTEGTDHLPFDDIGIPGFQFIPDPLDSFPALHHTNQDVYDHCVEEDLIQSPIVMAAFVYHAAMSEEMLPRKPLSIPVEMK
jgi:carboxypeptidase Q